MCLKARLPTHTWDTLDSSEPQQDTRGGAEEVEWADFPVKQPY